MLNIVWDNEIINSNKLFKLNGTKYTIDCFIGQSKSITEIKSLALLATRISSTVLICGERGVGKELLAQSIHNADNRRQQRPFIKVDCAALPEEMAEAELYGYEVGAFAGAFNYGKPGIFELANGGTIFLDNVDKMPLSLQGRLLRFTQGKEIERLGGTRTEEIDVRIVAATNKDLWQLAKEGLFRKELYFRLKVLDITIPPLREHIQDIPCLLNYYLDIYNNKFNKQIKGLTMDALEFLNNYQWPGNIREFKNMIEKAVAVCQHAFITFNDLGINFWEQNKHSDHRFSLVIPETKNKPLKETEVEAIFNALKITRGNKSKAAKLLGISRSTLYDRLKTSSSALV